MELLIDREKVIRDLQDAVNDDWMWQHADYYALTMERAIALLKEQEPKLVRIDEDSVHCPSCGNELFTYPRQKFCDECGQAVKWE